MTNTGRLTAIVTHLEMTSLPLKRVPVPSGPRLALMRTTAMPVSFYRYLYEQVGKPHHWMMRRAMDDDALASAIHANTAEIWVLYCNGASAGFFELDLARLPQEAQVLYLGLVSDFKGRGLGRFLLSEAVFAAFAHAPGKIVIETNTLDSAHALVLYQKAGFRPAGQSRTEIEAWE